MLKLTANNKGGNAKHLPPYGHPFAVVVILEKNYYLFLIEACLTYSSHLIY